MKDTAHHLRNVQRKVIRSTRREEQNHVDNKPLGLTAPVASVEFLGQKKTARKEVMPKLRKSSPIMR
jgi:hypothetical protein